MPDDAPDPSATLQPPSGTASPSTAPGSQTDVTVVPHVGAIGDADLSDGVTQVRSGPHVGLAGRGALPTVPGFAVTRELARGGMGVVYLAHDPVFERDVAVKVMHPGQDADRFVIESKITAQLPHPGVPPVYTLGTLTDGRPFLAMKLIGGRTLSAELRDEEPPELSRVLSTFERICETVGFAHSRGIVHRDLKPANVMVGAFGEVQVMDWGLAKELVRPQRAKSAGSPEGNEQPVAPDETFAGQIKGTPAYMAPEQARGEPVDARADVFSLGAILAVVLTGKAPFGGSTILDTVDCAARGDVVECFTRLDGCGADPDLIAVAKRCLAPSPGARYANGAETAAAITAYRAGVEERLRAAERDRAASEVRAAEQRKRRRVQFALAASLVMFLVTGGGAAWYSDRQASERALRAARESAERQATEARLEGERDAEARSKAAQASQGIDAALVLATDLRKQYRFKEAGGALDQADKLTEGAPERRASVDHARADLTLVERLDAIRYRKWFWSNRAGGGDFDTQLAPPAYRKAFADHGLDLAALDPTDAGTRIAAHPARAELVAALDDWALYEPDRQFRNRLLEIARRADPDCPLVSLRAPATRESIVGVVSLATAPASATAAPAAVSALATLLTQMGFDPSVLLATARHRHPNDFELAFALAQWHMAKGRSADALTFYEVARAIRPDNAAVWNNLGAALHNKGDVTGATAAFAKAVELDPSYAAAHNNIGKMLADRGDLTGAVAAFERAIKADPQHLNAHLGLGNALFEKKDYDGAIKSFRTMLKFESGNAAAHNNLGNALAAKGEPDAAIAAYKEAIRRDPGYARPWHGLGRVLDDRGDKADALAAYKGAVERAPRDATALMDLGNALHDQGDVGGAIATHRRAVEAAPKDAATHYNLGRALWAKDDAKGAAAAFREAIELNPNLFQAHTNLSGALNDLGDADGSIAAAREAMRCDPKDSRPHNNMGIALVIKGDLDGAVASFREAVRLNPKNTDAKENLEQALKDRAARREKK